MTPLSASLIRALVSRALATSIANGPRASLLPNRAHHGVYAQQQAARLRAQQAECTFEPKLDARSARLVAAKSDARRPVTERLYEQQAVYMNRRVLAQMAQRTEEEKECTFKPAIKGGGGGGGSSIVMSSDGAMKPVPHSHAPHARKPLPVSSEEAELQTKFRQRRPLQVSSEEAELQTKFRQRRPLPVSSEEAELQTKFRQRRPLPVSSEEAELQMHCTFKPRLNHYALSDGLRQTTARVDSEDPHADEALMAAYRLSHPPAPQAPHRAAPNAVPSASAAGTSCASLSGGTEAANALHRRAAAGGYAGGYGGAASGGTGTIPRPMSAVSGATGTGPSAASARVPNMGYAGGLGWRDRVGPLHAGWGVYDAGAPGCAVGAGTLDQAEKEVALARSLQAEIRDDVARLMVQGAGAAAGDSAAAAAAAAPAAAPAATAAAAALAHAQSAAAAASSPVTLLRRNEPTQGYAQGGGARWRRRASAWRACTMSERPCGSAALTRHGLPYRHCLSSASSELCDQHVPNDGVGSALAQ